MLSLTNVNFKANVFFSKFFLHVPVLLARYAWQWVWWIGVNKAAFTQWWKLFICCWLRSPSNMPLPCIHIPVHKMTNDVHRVIDSNYSQKTFLMHTLPILLIKKEVIDSVFLFIVDLWIQPCVLKEQESFQYCKRILLCYCFEAVIVKPGFLIHSIDHHCSRN